jgi:hypothetical protein
MFCGAALAERIVLVTTILHIFWFALQASLCDPSRRHVPISALFALMAFPVFDSFATIDSQFVAAAIGKKSVS